MNPGEPEALLALISSADPVRVLEIGVNEGLTAKFLMDNVPSIQSYIGVDVLPKTSYSTEHKIQQREISATPGKYATHYPAFKMLLRENGSFDVSASELGSMGAVFIDGDHGRKAVEHDTELARTIVKRGGIIVWHDYHGAGTVGVQDVLEEMWRAGRPIQYVEGTWLAFERIPKSA